MQVTVKAFTVVPSRSAVLRPPAEREVLNLFGARMAAVSLSGFIFFGSSLSISDQVSLADFHTQYTGVYKALSPQSDIQQAVELMSASHALRALRHSEVGRIPSISSAASGNATSQSLCGVHADVRAMLRAEGFPLCQGSQRPWPGLQQGSDRCCNGVLTAADIHNLGLPAGGASCQGARGG